MQVLRPDVAYNQLDGAFAPVGGSEPAYNLSTYLGTTYKNDRDVTFITGPNGPGDQDVWMTGFIDGECDITGGDDVGTPPGECSSGKVSYLGGHQFNTGVPVTPAGQGTRLFLNALFEADCATAIGQPDIGLSLQGDIVLGAQTVPADGVFTAAYANAGRGLALDATLTLSIPAGVDIVAADGEFINQGDRIDWAIGSISSNAPLAGDPPNQDARSTTLRFPSYGDYEIEVRMRYRTGQSWHDAPVRTVTVRVSQDSDGDGVPDGDDPAPDDASICGDSDSDTCDDCTSGTFDPDNDGPDADADGTCDAGEGPGGTGDPGGCGCRTTSPAGALPWLVVALVLVLRRRRRYLSTGAV